MPQVVDANVRHPNFSDGAVENRRRKSQDSMAFLICRKRRFRLSVGRIRAQEISLTALSDVSLEIR